MAIIKYANRTEQAGIFYTGSPNYVDVDNTFTVPASRISFAVTAANTSQPDGAWATGDMTGILVKKDESNYKLWLASWDANEFLYLVKEELSVGTISNTDAVTVSAVLTSWMMNEIKTQQQYTLVSGTTYTVLASDLGKVLRCTSASNMTITIPDTLPVGFTAAWVREGAGTASIARSGVETINGATTPVAVSAQWKRGIFYKVGTTAWVATVT